jgi:phospholipid/cholesterol/gamma-HCH transport system ATP-binding protein
MPGYGDSMPSDLSGGQKKRIGLARAIITNPEIVLYDEPTTGLDPILSTIIENFIVQFSHQFKVTSIVVTHQISTIYRTADKIYFMLDGKLLAPESPATIDKSKNEIIRNFIKGKVVNNG